MDRRVTLYIYYRVPADRHDAALDAARALQAAVAAETGCRPQLARRAEDGETWMEIYPDLSDVGVLRASLARHLAICGLLELAAERHQECFVPL